MRQSGVSESSSLGWRAVWGTGFSILFLPPLAMVTFCAMKVLPVAEYKLAQLGGLTANAEWAGAAISGLCGVFNLLDPIGYLLILLTIVVASATARPHTGRWTKHERGVLVLLGTTYLVSCAVLTFISIILAVVATA